MLLQTLVSGPNVGVMIPIPQYPLYSATIDLLEGEKVGYFLEEDAGWELNVRNLEQAYREAQARGVTVSALCLINPGVRVNKSVSPFCIST
jgi:alanine transaminase